MRPPMVGDVVKCICDILDNSEGSLGFVYYVSIENIKDPRAFIIFENGEYDEFSGVENHMMFKRVTHEKTLASYKFKNDIQLSKDFDNGVFDAVFA